MGQFRVIAYPAAPGSGTGHGPLWVGIVIGIIVVVGICIQLARRRK